MRIIMAVSRDGYCARSDRDDMQWLGRDDKAVFRILTSVGGDCYAGRRTAELMPAQLQGRHLIPLSRTGGNGSQSLETLRRHPGEPWLLGGQTVAIAALSMVRDTGSPLVAEIHLCRSDRCAFPHGQSHFDRITPLLMAYGLAPAMTTRMGDVSHELWRLQSPINGP